ncbi:MAG: potassium channel family protein [Kofleriaceae bacterium]
MAAREVSAWAVLRQRLAFPLLALIATHIIGVAGYMFLWRDQGGTFSDAVYMTFTTVATIGFGEVKPLDDTGRVLTMFIAAGGIGSAFYSFTVTLDWLASGEIQATRRRRKMKEMIDSLSGHYILVGFGRVGREALRELDESGKRVVVIDISDENIAAAAESGWLYIKGDASDDEVLRAAGVARARGLIATTANDAANLYIVMSARLLAPDLHIVSRAVEAHAVPKLERAGANRAVNPYAIGGRRMAHLLLSPRIVDFFETALHRGNKTLSIGEIRVVPSSAGIGSTIGKLRQRSGGATLLAVVRSPDGAVALATDKLVLASGDHLLALGTDEQLEALESALGA